MSADARHGTITEYGGGGLYQPQGITSGPGDNLWFSEVSSGKIDYITTQGAITTVAAVSPPLVNLSSTILTGPHDELFFSTYDNSTNHQSFFEMTPQGVLSPAATPVPITSMMLGPDGNYWYITETVGPPGSPPPFTTALVRLTPSGVVTEFDGPTPANPNGKLDGAYSFTFASDGNIWFLTYDGYVGKVTTRGVVTKYLIPPFNYTKPPAGGPPGTGGVTLAAGLDAVWFTVLGKDAQQTGFIGKVDTATGKISEYGGSLAHPYGIVQGPDRAMWFTEAGVAGAAWTDAIGRIDRAGNITEYAKNAFSWPPYDIALGPDGNLWFTEPGASRGPTGSIGRFIP